MEQEIEKKELQKIKKIFEKVDIASVIDLMIEMMMTLGSFAQTVGKIERDYGDAFEAFKVIGQSPELLDELTKNAPPEVLGLFMRILLKMTAFRDELDNLMKLPPKEKIKVGKALVDIANDIKKLKKEVEKSRR